MRAFVLLCLVAAVTAATAKFEELDFNNDGQIDRSEFAFGDG